MSVFLLGFAWGLDLRKPVLNDLLDPPIEQNLLTFNQFSNKMIEALGLHSKTIVRSLGNSHFSVLTEFHCSLVVKRCVLPIDPQVIISPLCVSGNTQGHWGQVLVAAFMSPAPCTSTLHSHL